MSDQGSSTYQLEKEIAKLKEHVESQQEMLASTTRFLMQAQETLTEQKQNLLRKNTEIFDSINYAGFVQSGLFPDGELVRSHFRDSFIYLKQRDVIGGDLPFFRSYGDEVFLAAIDCTGHGVSGAILTAMAHSFLNEATNKLPTDLGAVLEFLNAKFLSVFNTDVKTYFGMDAAIVKLNTATYEMEFAGAGRPLLVISDGKIEKISKTGLSIGLVPDHRYGSEKLTLKPNDKLYLFSDGITDQLGDRVPKKFTESRLRELLEEIKHLRMVTQKEAICDILLAWQGKNEQTDDQLIIGIKLK